MSRLIRGLYSNWYVTAKINNRPASLRTMLNTGDVVEIGVDETTKPQLEWLEFVRTGKARSSIRHYFKTMMHSESRELGEKLLVQALRVEGIESFTEQHAQHDAGGIYDGHIMSDETE